MRLLADESLAGRSREFLRRLGHTVLTVTALGRAGATNGEVLALAKRHEAILIAEDRGFANVLNYPLGTHRGIVILKIRAKSDIDASHRHLAEALTTLSADQLSGSLLIVDRTKSRLRRPT